jgi:hypothetical protein
LILVVGGATRVVLAAAASCCMAEGALACGCVDTSCCTGGGCAAGSGGAAAAAGALAMAVAAGTAFEVPISCRKECAAPCSPATGPIWGTCSKTVPHACCHVLCCAVLCCAVQDGAH